MDRPATPESPTMSSSLYNATSTIDDLTHALADFSRAPSPEPPGILTCCCGEEDCENLKSWINLKSKLESRLILSAEVGQALLQRHEAHIRRQQNRRVPSHLETTAEEAQYIDSRVAELTKENAVLEKRLMQSLVNNEVSEVSNNTVLQELGDARAVVARLTVSAARATGYEKRMLSALQEKEDMQQERNSEAQRAKIAEGRIAALKERTTKMQVEIRRLQEDLESRRMQRMASSDSVLQDARSKLELFQLGRTATLAEETELASVMESLVDDNESLKRDNTELQSLLSESREDAHALQEEVNELRVQRPPRATGDRRHSRAFSYNGVTPVLFNPNRRPPSIDSRRGIEPLTPETDRRPLSPDSLAPTPRYPFAHLTLEDEEPVPASPRTHKPLYLLALSRGVQTDEEYVPTPAPSLLPSSFGDHLSPHEARSESSSMTDSQSPHLSILVERVVTLLNRMTQADALTLTTRLKRQHLRGADVGHLSRTTVNAILSEATNLRGQFRALLEDGKMTTICTRKDLRGLLKVFRDLFVEMGQMRVSLNDVILDPSIAPRLSELALDPAKAEAERLKASGGPGSPGNGNGGWMAPISKLFGASNEVGNSSGRSNPPVGGLLKGNSTRGRTETRPPLRVIPKLRPALAASATTVNVEFSGSGVGRSTASTSITPAITIAGATKDDASDRSLDAGNMSSSVMGIFAGAPAPRPSSTPDPWVVLPKGTRRVQSSLLAADTLVAPGFRRPGMRNERNVNRRLSRNVDAIIDVDSPIPGNGTEEDDESDAVAPLLERTLRRRGLSDSSVHSTFVSQAADQSALEDYSYSYTNDVPHGPGPSMFQVLSRKVQILRSVASSTFSPSASGEITSSTPTKPTITSPAATIRRAPNASMPTSPAFARMMPNVNSWAAAGAETPDVPFYLGSAREESHMPGRRRDYF